MENGNIVFRIGEPYVLGSFWMGGEERGSDGGLAVTNLAINMKTPSHPGAVSEVRHLASQKDGRVFEVRPGLKFYKPSPGPTLSRRRV